MAAGDIETFHRNGTWFNRIQGEASTLGPGFNDREDAIAAGRSAATARQVEHSIRTEEGPSDDRNLFGTHPRDLIG
ncbi:DUF2188 domain-containing protein [Microbacterium paludicola]|uniref:DUF2188 domain-containing protein n=1 Tax=Microbacterium paludicola TaxID=300019 RepID=UPI0011A82372|nr:DUF2188 domain-containing protein [Microbacterium paludicola]